MNKQAIADACVEFDARMEADRLLVKSLLDRGEFLDEDGYPTDDALTIVEKWHWDDPKGWFKFIENIWYLRSWGWGEGVADHEWQKDTQVYLYEISTAGWSGNESLIHAMMKNDMLWNTTWVQSRRGGHYIFEVDRDERTNP